MDNLGKHNDELYNKFSAVFDADAEMIAAGPSQRLGDAYGFSGMEYSLPVMLYVMDRVLSDDDTAEERAQSYEYYLQNIHMMGGDAILEHVSQAVAESFCRDAIQELRQMKQVKMYAEINAGNCNNDTGFDL